MIFVQIRSSDMWTTESTIETTVGADAIWRAWADVARWPEWNGDIEHIVLTGPFAAGSSIVMTPRDQVPVHLRVADVVEGEQFVDEAEIAGTVFRTMHRIEALDGERVRVVYRMEASGPAAEEIGPAITSDFDDTLKALVEHAGR
jgi:hypothetical protein